MTRRRFRSLGILVGLLAPAAVTVAQEVEAPTTTPATPTTRATPDSEASPIFTDGVAEPPGPRETRTSHRELHVYAPLGNPTVYDVVRTVLRKRFDAIAPEFNLSPDAAADALRIDGGGPEYDGAINVDVTLKLHPPAKGASKEMMERLLSGLPAELRQTRQQKADERLKELKSQRDQLAARRDAARKRYDELMSQARQLSGHLEPAPQRVRAAAADLEAEQQRIELDLLAKTARREAMEEQIAGQTAAMEKKLADDPIIAELGKVVAAREKRLEVVRNMVKEGNASLSEIDDAVATVAESRAKLLQHKREAAMEAGGDILQSFNRELLTLSVDLRELTVRRDAIKKRLAELGEALSRIEQAQEADHEAAEARNKLETVETAIREAEPFAPRAGEVRVTVSNKVDTHEIERTRAEPLK